jgi:hypothetical protein
MATDMEKFISGIKKNCPLLTKWSAIKMKHKALMNRSIFKTDIEPSIKTLDDAVQRFTDALEDKKKLVAIIDAMNTGLDKTSADSDKLKADRDKNEDEIENNKNMAQIDAYDKQPDADPADVLKTFNDLAASYVKSFNLHKKVVDDLVKNGESKVALIQKGRDDYKAQSEKVMAAMDKAGADAKKAEADAISTLGDYLDTSEEIENADLQKQLQAFLKLV